jgi:hypothetical protein
MDILNDAMNVFKQYESEADFEQRKIKNAQSIIGTLAKLRVMAEKVRTNIECEVAVIQTQQLIDGE